MAATGAYMGEMTWRGVGSRRDCSTQQPRPSVRPSVRVCRAARIIALRHRKMAPARMHILSIRALRRRISYIRSFVALLRVNV